MTTTVKATEFCRNFGAYQRRVQREAIEVRSHGNVTGYFISPEAFAKLERIVADARRAYHPSELPEPLKAAIGRSRMGPAHDDLNDLLYDE